MPKKSLPYILLALLFAILLFILGVRYGQRVEQVNKTISYLVHLPPSPTLAPTSIPLAFSDYSHEGCKVSFLIPNELDKTSESSSSALFSTKKNKLAIALSCEKKVFIKGDKELSIALNNTIRAYEIQTNDTVSYRIYYPTSGKIITITSLKAYLPLIKKSIELISK